MNCAIWNTVTFHVGDTVRVHYKLIEHEKVAGKAKREVKVETRERTQVFEGIVIAIKGSGANCMFTVRKIGAGAIGIERIFPLVSPWIKKLQVKKPGAVRRAKLYYLRNKQGKEASKVNVAAV
jgi:large subunit ribosomal protein L19